MPRVLISSLLIIFLFGCSSVPVRFSNVTSGAYEELGEGEGSATGIMLLNFIPIGQNDRLERAYKDAIFSKNGDALINPVVSEQWFWAYVLNGYITTVKGTVIKYKK